MTTPPNPNPSPREKTQAEIDELAQRFHPKIIFDFSTLMLTLLFSFNNLNILPHNRKIFIGGLSYSTDDGTLRMSKGVHKSTFKKKTNSIILSQI